jgi:hypothetical protein
MNFCGLPGFLDVDRSRQEVDRYNLTKLLILPVDVPAGANFRFLLLKRIAVYWNSLFGADPL